jgi:hypothetical protein
MIKWISQNYSIIQFLKVSMLSSMHLWTRRWKGVSHSHRIILQTVQLLQYV